MPDDVHVLGQQALRVRPRLLEDHHVRPCALQHRAQPDCLRVLTVEIPAENRELRSASRLRLGGSLRVRQDPDRGGQCE